MAKRVRVTVDGVDAVARLHEEAAPETVARFWAALPIDTTVRHVRWSGDAGYILIRQLADKTQAIENAVSFYPPASIAFRPEHGEMAFSYGQAQARDHGSTGSWACHLATFEGDAARFFAKVEATRAEGGKSMRIAREEGR
jgi:hypothetical protein